MKQYTLLKYQYTLAQFLYWVTCCACTGFVAVYLQYKGLSDSNIGIIVAACSVLSLIFQPISSKLVQKISFLTVRKMIIILSVLMGGLFALITYIPVSITVTIVVFSIIYGLNGCIVPLMSSLGMEYVNQKQNVDFGVARGFGSLGWALSAVFIGFLLEKFSPMLIGPIYIIAAAMLIINILFMKDMGHLTESSETIEKEEGILRKCLSDTTFLFVALGSCLNLISHAVCTTYTINVVRSVGGNETAAGLAQFFGAASEMIGMVIVTRLLRKYGSTHVLKISGAFFAIRFLFLAFAGNLPMIMIGYALQGPSTGLYIPAAVYFVNERMLPNQRTQGQAIFNILTNGMASFIGNLIGGRMLDSFGLQFTLWACFLFAAIGCLCIGTRKSRK